MRKLKFLALSKAILYDLFVAAPSHLKSLQAVELAVRMGSLVAAAEVLGISPAAVGQRVKALEDYLGSELLVRTRTGIHPSPALAAALPHLKNAFGELKIAAGELELQRGCELHVAAPPDFVELWLEPRLCSFTQAYPHVEFCINGVGDAPLRLRKADCEIRFGQPPAEHDQAEILFHDLIAPICSPGTFKRRAALLPEVRLEDYPILHLDFYKNDPAGISWPEWIERNGLMRTAPTRGIRFQRVKSVLDAVLADAGFTLCGLSLIRHLIESGGVMLAYPEKQGIWTQWAFITRFPTDVRKRPPVRWFREWLLEESRATSDWLNSGAGQSQSARLTTA